MSGFAIGARLNDVMTETENVSGAGMTPGTLVTGHNGNVYVRVKATASQNLINGNVVMFDANWGATALTADPQAPAGVGAGVMLGVAVCSVTASASQLLFAQIFGQGNVRMTNTTASNLPNHILVAGSTAGELKGGAATASAYISGIVLTATCSLATLSTCFINYPRMAIA